MSSPYNFKSTAILSTKVEDGQQKKESKSRMKMGDKDVVFVCTHYLKGKKRQKKVY